MEDNIPLENNELPSDDNIKTGPAVVVAGVFYGVWAVHNYNSVRDKAFARAKALAAVTSPPKPGIVNLGCGTCHYISESSLRYAFDEYVCCNVDMAPAPDVHDIPNYLCIDLEKPLPFGGNQFSVVFASHCLEHLTNWQLALSEWSRIADHVIIVLPHPLNIGQLSDVTHKRYVSWGWINQVKEYPQVEVYC